MRAPGPRLLTGEPGRVGGIAKKADLQGYDFVVRSVSASWDGIGVDDHPKCTNYLGQHPVDI